jgi:hypothetical protein
MAEVLKPVVKLKHGRKVVVAFRTVPGEPENCIVVATESLDADQHDTLINLVESNAGQSVNDLADAMARTQLPDGRIMLEAFHAQGKMVKYATNEVVMIPNSQTSIPLNELNQATAEADGISVEDLAVKPKGETTTQTTTAAPVVEEAPQDGVLSDEDLAKSYRSQADRLSKEAAQLRRQAEELVPTKKKSKSAESA